MNITPKKILLFGFIAVLLVGIPVSLYLLQQQQETRSRAERSTSLSFLPQSSTTAPIKKAVGEEVTLDVQVNPGKNIVSFVKLEIQYDETKLATAEANGFSVNETAFPVTLEGPAYSPGKIAVTLSIGSDPTKAIQTVTRAATVKFKAKADTGTTPTNVIFGNGTEILSIGETDQAQENVLLNVNPAVIAIGGTSTVTPSISVQPSVQPSITKAPTTPVNPTTPPGQPTAVPTAAPTPGPTTANQLPVCSNLNLDRANTGTAPYSITFTAVGTDADGTIQKVTFNYGDGPIEPVTSTGGIGTNTVSVQRSHTYNNPGTYTASASLTDSGNAVNDPATCKQTIVVLAPQSGGPGTGGGTTPVASSGAQPTVSIAKPGAGDLMIGAGAIALLLTVVGGFLFFAL